MMEQDHRKRPECARTEAHAAAETQLQRLGADVLTLRAMGEHGRAEALTRRRDTLARATYQRAIRG